MTWYGTRPVWPWSRTWSTTTTNGTACDMLGHFYGWPTQQILGGRHDGAWEYPCVTCGHVAYFTEQGEPV